LILLADKVGLGKTIETGLVLQSLIQEKPDIRRGTIFGSRGFFYGVPAAGDAAVLQERP
jgi:hypothetical protein